MTEHHKINAELDRKTYMFSSSQLLDYDEGQKTDDKTEQTHSKSGVDSEGLSCMFEKENMRVVQLLGHLCNGGTPQSSPAGGSQCTADAQ